MLKFGFRSKLLGKIEKTWNTLQAFEKSEVNLVWIPDYSN